VMSPIVLANAGFQYSGLGDRVRCPVCRIEIEGWQSGDLTSPAVEHRRRSPQCPLATQCAYPRDDGALVADVERMLKDQSLNERATSPHRLSSDVSCSPTNRSLNMTEVLNSAVRRAKTHGVVDPPPSTSSDAGLTTVDRTNPDYDLLKFESTRLGTFYDWPATAVAKPSDLAANGWFYTGQHDRVRCAFCRGVLHHWTKDDVPSSEHRRHFPDCPFVKGRDVGNVSLEHSEQTSVTEAVGTALKSAAERMSALGFDDGRWGAAGNSDESLRSDAIGSNSTSVARQTAVDRNADVTSSETHRRVAKSRDARSPEMNSESSAIEAGTRFSFDSLQSPCSLAYMRVDSPFPLFGFAVLLSCDSVAFDLPERIFRICQPVIGPTDGARSGLEPTDQIACTNAADRSARRSNELPQVGSADSVLTD
jgi:hypothetical protein